MMRELTELQAQMTGWMTVGNYMKVAEMARSGSLEDVEFALRLAFKDGYEEALKVISHVTNEQLRTEWRRRR